MTAVFSLIAGTATTFSVATPLISTFIIKIFSLDVSCTIISEFILVITFILYTYAVLKKSKGISILANFCVIFFFLLLAYVLLFGGQTKYIIETGFESFGKMTQNFLELSCFEDPLRKTSFPQNWPVYYWDYWMVWCVAAPFFIGSISRGRTIRQKILGGYLFGSGSTLVSFVILGNYSMGLQMTGKVDFLLQYHKTNVIYSTVVSIVETLPYPQLTMILISITMIAFYATSFDSIALTASGYGCRNLKGKRKTACFNSIILVHYFDNLADFAALFKKFNVKPSKRQHHCGISDWNHLVVNCLQFSERCQKFFEIIKKRQPNRLSLFYQQTCF